MKSLHLIAAAALLGATTLSIAQPGPGRSMMSADERAAHRQQMAGFKTYEECKAYMDKHHDDMAARAKERGITMPAAPRRDACAGLKAPAK